MTLDYFLVSKVVKLRRPTSSNSGNMMNQSFHQTSLQIPTKIPVRVPHIGIGMIFCLHQIITCEHLKKNAVLWTNILMDG